MRWKDAFIYTLREEPAEAELVSHKLMLRAGMIQKVASGIYNYLPCGLRVIRKIERIVREEMARCGAAELLMPVVVPSELWQESGRWNYYGPELLRFKDRKNNEFCLGPTHEEVVVDIARHTVKSYRDMPLCLYQIQTKFRDEVRPRYGLMRGREFIMKDAYSFHVSEECLDMMYWRMHNAYSEIFSRCGLDFRPVEADSGTIGGDVTHEFHVLADSGEDVIASCRHCGYAANIEKAQSRPERTEPPDVAADAAAVTPVATPEKKTIEEVSAFLECGTENCVKMLLYSVNNGEALVAVCIRGDLPCNEAKLRVLLGVDMMDVPDEETVRGRFGLTAGYLGAHGLDRTHVRAVYADYSVAAMKDCVCGANIDGFHLIHCFPKRDLQIDRYVDLGFAGEGRPCPLCDDGVLALRKGIEVGQVFKLGRKYSGAMRMSYLDEDGASKVPIMGCYGIGIGRTAAAAVEQNHDDRGIIWPVSISPFTVTILCLDPANEEVAGTARLIHDRLEEYGIDVLLDDREERPGVKFMDADLVGCAIRVTVGARGLKDGIVEIKRRQEKENVRISLDQAVSCVHDMINQDVKQAANAVME